METPYVQNGTLIHLLNYQTSSLIPLLQVVSPSTIHRTFPPYDLLFMILREADVCTCATAARVCRLWHEPAKNEIWKDPMLVPLLQTLAPLLRKDGWLDVRLWHIFVGPRPTFLTLLRRSTILVGPYWPKIGHDSASPPFASGRFVSPALTIFLHPCTSN